MGTEGTFFSVFKVCVPVLRGKRSTAETALY